MSKRNIILITIVLVIIASVALGFMYFYKPVGQTGTGTTGTNFFSTFFPFGKSKTVNNATNNNPADISGYVAPTNSNNAKELLTEVSSMPVAGYTVFMKERFTNPSPALPKGEGGNAVSPVDNSSNITTPLLLPPPSGKGKGGSLTAPTTEFAPALRYVERATGNIYQTFADKIDERKFTTTVIPQVYDAYFGDSGNSVVMRYLKEDGTTIESFAGTLPKEILGQDTSITDLNGSFLPENITDMSLSPNDLSIFYLFNSGNNTIGVTASSYGDKKNQIFNSSFNEWLSGWPNARMITLTTKPSFNASGFMYSLDPNTKKMNKILGNINGLTTLVSPSGKLILYNDNNLSLNIYNTDTEDSVSIGIRTMPEKCTWNKTSTTLYCAVPKYVSGTNYPDTWYQGETSFSDDIWKLNVSNGSATDIADPTSFERGSEIDGIKLSLDDNENYLFFVNKKDSYLWELKIN